MKHWLLVTAFTTGEAAAIVVLVGFLGLIWSMLSRWSSDTSWKDGPVIK
jgi:hypothetical protein